jgi:hypothetical protein
MGMISYFGLEHARFFRAGQSIHIRGRAAAAIAESYFDQLWYDPRVFRLRSLSGNNTEEVARLASSFGAEVDLTRI